MTDFQLSLIDVPRARETDDRTSHMAAARIKESGSLARQQAFVLEAVRRWPGQTASELAQKMAGYYTEEMTLGWRFYHEWTRRRLPELNNVHIQKGERRKCRVSGFSAATWEPK